jgi:cytochrome c oxidase cbb3-type subunit 2
MSTPLDTRALVANVETNREVGTPYTDEMIANVMADLKAQVSPDTPEAAALLKRYPKAVVRKFDPSTPEVTEGDAVVAYLQMLGTLVDFKQYDDKANLR